MAIRFTLNGAARELDTDPEKPLLWALREDMGLPGTKFGCGAGLCGACTVHLEGAAIRSCLTPVGAIEGSRSPLSKAWPRLTQDAAWERPGASSTCPSADIARRARS